MQNFTPLYGLKKYGMSFRPLANTDSYRIQDKELVFAMKSFNSALSTIREKCSLPLPASPIGFEWKIMGAVADGVLRHLVEYEHESKSYRDYSVLKSRALPHYGLTLDESVESLIEAYDLQDEDIVLIEKLIE